LVPSLNEPHLIFLDLVVDLSPHVGYRFAYQLLHARLALIGKIFLEVDPPRQPNPYFMLFFRSSLLQLVPYIQQYLIPGPNRIIKVRKSAGSVGLSLEDRLVGFFRLHRFFNAREVFFMLDVGFLYVIELLFAGLIGLKTAFIE
jgi:hypothetical protein